MTETQSYQFKFLLGDESGNNCNKAIMSGRQNQFLCDPRHWARTFPGKLTPRLVDLLRIAAAVYVTDRISRRDRLHADFGWSRSLKMQIEVLDFEFWSSQETMGSLHRCLDFLSGDQWDISFSPTSSPFDSGLLPFSSDWKPLTENPVICMYSGGLDSAAGLVHYMDNHDSRDIVPLLVRHSGQGKLVEEQIAAINLAIGANLKPLILPFWMRSPENIGCREETSQRTRSFLFCSAAGVAASLIDAKSIEMMEGGIGAINLPLMTGMVGSKATRSSHPTFLRRFSDLLQMVTNRDLAVELPHQYLTKAEITRSLVDSGLGKLALETASCVHYPIRDSSAKQCGTCPACIFRRQAIVSAGIDDCGYCYQHDLFSIGSSNIPEEKLLYLKAFLMQIDKLSSLDYSNQLPSFVIRHLRATDVIIGEHVPAKLVDLYKRYRIEWLHLVERGQHEGWKWTQMMAPVLSNS